MQDAFFDVWVFNLLASSNRNTTIPALLKANERTKRRSYEQRIIEVEHGSFTPLVFADTGGMSPAVSTFYKRLASMIAKKHNQDCGLRTINWTGYWLRFSPFETINNSNPLFKVNISRK